MKKVLGYGAIALLTLYGVVVILIDAIGEFDEAISGAFRE